MYRHYLLVALQGLKRQPAISSIKIMSLAIGLACSILVIMHVQYIYSFDKHFPGWQHTYRLVSSFGIDQRIDTSLSSNAIAPQLLLDYPQIQHIAKTQQGSAIFSRGDSYIVSDFTWVDPAIVQIFGFEFINGDAETSLDQPNSIVLSESASRKYFQNENPIGQTLTMDNKLELKVTGVIRDLPENSSTKVEMLIPAAAGRQLHGQDFMADNFWMAFSSITYLSIPDSDDAAYISADLPGFVQRNLPEDQKAFANRSELALYLEPLSDVYLSPRLPDLTEADNSKVLMLAGLSIFAVLILMTSCINFANLSLTQTQQRGKEVGIRMSIGAKHGQVIWQFLFEALVLTLIAFLIALFLIWLAIPVYTTFTGTNFTAASVLRTDSVAVLLAFVIVMGILSGIVPAFALSRFKPASIIRGTVGNNGGLSRMLRPLVTVVQFSFASALIMLALAIMQQISYLNSMDLGFDKSNLVIVDNGLDGTVPDGFDYEPLINDLRREPGILFVGKSLTAPPITGNFNPWRRPNFPPNESRPATWTVVDADFVDTLQLKLLAGRSFQKEFATDFSPFPLGASSPPQNENEFPSLVITRSAVRYFDFESAEDALNQALMVGPFTFKIIGVIEDYKLGGDLEDPLKENSILRATRDPLGVLWIRIDNAAQIDKVLTRIDAIWARHRPDVPISRTLFDQKFNSLVLTRTKGISTAAIFASIITILIAASGLYALAHYSTTRRTKEVGIRKVLGATSKSVIGLLTWDFLKPVIVACIGGALMGYFAIHHFIQQYTARTEISSLLYLLVAAGAVSIATLTVSLHCYNVASMKPVQSLRVE